MAFRRPSVRECARRNTWRLASIARPTRSLALPYTVLSRVTQLALGVSQPYSKHAYHQYDDLLAQAFVATAMRSGKGKGLEERFYEIM